LGIEEFNNFPIIMDFTLFFFFSIFKVFGNSIDKPVPGCLTVFFSGVRQPFGKPFLRLTLSGGFCRLAGRTAAGIRLGLIVPKPDIPDSTGAGIPFIEAVGIAGN
jgi:hypothetical protein